MSILPQGFDRTRPSATGCRLKLGELEQTIMPKNRKEKDSLGTIAVPARAYYGAQTARAIHNYPISGMRAHSVLIRAIAMVKRAAAETNKHLGLVDARRADAISAAAQEVIDGKWDEEFLVDVFQAGAGVSFHMNANEVIANRANEIMGGEMGGGKLGEYAHVHPNDHVNYGQSTNDVFPTAMRLSTLLALEDLYPVLDSLARTFENKAKEFDSILKSGRTHLQDAVPIRLGQEFAAYAVAIRKSRANISQQSEVLRELGRAALAGARNHSHLQRPAPARLRPQHRPGRNRSAQPAARLLHHARQNQSCDGGAGGHGQLPGHRQ
jgi:aspartate ammonia-lyase